MPGHNQNGKGAKVRLTFLLATLKVLTKQNRLEYSILNGYALCT